MPKLTEEDNQLKGRIKSRIKNILNEKDLNQADYALESDTDRQSVNRLVNDNNIRGISIYTINRFCKVIKISLDEFFNDPLFK